MLKLDSGLVKLGRECGWIGDAKWKWIGAQVVEG
jgi:hypothetical protein